MSITSAPASSAACARAYPCLPEELLVMMRTGSIGSWVPPAVMTIFLPFQAAAAGHQVAQLGHDIDRFHKAALSDRAGGKMAFRGTQNGMRPAG